MCSPAKFNSASSSEIIALGNSRAADSPGHLVDGSISEQTATSNSPEHLTSDVVVQLCSPAKFNSASSSEIIALSNSRAVDLPGPSYLSPSPVILTMHSNDPSPCSAKRGLPQWFRGNVSSAFASHIFYPSPPKKKGGKLAPTQLFPACVSSHKWRELHRLKTVKTPPAVKTSTKKITR